MEYKNLYGYDIMFINRDDYRIVILVVSYFLYIMTLGSILIDSVIPGILQCDILFVLFAKIPYNVI